ncbi:MAG: response regulator transcription factor, partial [Acidobacteria bacterium]|nr:response regulator transcription factor [Acidobacteriota bacterium]
MSRPSVLLADDHRIVLEGLKTLLEREFEVVGAVEDGRALVAAAKDLDPDVIVVDVSMPILNGIEAAHQIRKAGSRAKILFLTMHPDATYAARAYEAGASGYVLKHSASAELVEAIREALRGKVYFSARIAAEAPRMKALHELTPRQREVLQLVAEGRSAKEIGKILHISSRTAEFHKYRIMHELNLQSSAEMVQFAIRHGIVSV